jgi:hypothetical protein
MPRGASFGNRERAKRHRSSIGEMESARMKNYISRRTAKRRNTNGLAITITNHHRRIVLVNCSSR